MRLEGSTWYQIQVEPQGYWAPLSDYLIHRTHLRVLEHTRRASVSGVSW